MLIGASLFFISGNKRINKFHNILSCLGFSLCIFAVYFLTSRHLYPGTLALLPTIGAALIILSPSSWVNRKILSNPVLVYVGLISYSLYLWHWPILSFFHIVEDDPSASLKWILLLISVVLSVLSFELVEKPIRSLSAPTRKRLTFYLLFASSVVLLIGLLVYNRRIPSFTQTERISKIVSVKNDWDNLGDSKRVSLSQEISYFVNGTGENSVLFLGDSQVIQYYPRMMKKMKMNQKLIFFPHGVCPQIPYLFDSNQRSDICPEILEATIGLVKKEKPKAIVISSFYSNHFSSHSSYIIKNQKAGYGEPGFELSMQYMEQHLLQFRKLGTKVYIVLNVPAGRQFDPSRMFQRSFSLNPVVLNIQKYKRSSDLQELRHIKARIRQTAEAAGAKVIDPSDYLCSVEECEVLDEKGFPKYMDEIHLRAGHVRDNIKYLDEVLDPWIGVPQTPVYSIPEPGDL